MLRVHSYSWGYFLPVFKECVTYKRFLPFIQGHPRSSLELLLKSSVNAFTLNYYYYYCDYYQYYFKRKHNATKESLKESYQRVPKYGRTGQLNQKDRLKSTPRHSLWHVTKASVLFCIGFVFVITILRQHQLGHFQKKVSVQGLDLAECPDSVLVRVSFFMQEKPTVEKVCCTPTFSGSFAFRATNVS